MPAATFEKPIAAGLAGSLPLFSVYKAYHAECAASFSLCGVFFKFYLDEREPMQGSFGGNSVFISFLGGQRRSRLSGIRQEQCEIVLGHRIVFLLRLRVPDVWRSIALLRRPLRVVLQATGEGPHQPHLRFLLVRASKWSTPASRLE